jgi:RNA-directed DNA polymerase
MTSTQPNAWQLRLDFLEAEPEAAAQNIPTDDSTLAGIEKSALGDDHSENSLMEAIVDEPNMEIAWARIKANRGAAGPDGVTVEDFPEWFTPRWNQIRRQLLDGTYQPSPARRVSIPKPDGGERNLSIPNLVDRVIQQAIVLILTPIFDPEFSESSFGYRPYRSAQDAVRQVQRIIRNGRRQCVDMDLSKFFDRVQHDVLMARVARKVRDKRLLKLIGRYLRAGVMVDGLCQRSDEGTMQGGPLSPLLSNIYLDDLDKELEKRGLPFVRYADDFVIFTASEAAAHRVYASVERFLRTKLKLKVNHDKSSVRRTDGLEYVGYEFRGYGGQIRVSRKKLAAFKKRVSEIFRRNRGVSMKKRYAEFRSYAIGWLGYFALDQVKTTFSKLDKWLRRRVRACYWKQWRKSKTRIRKLMSYGVAYREARMSGCSGKGPWRLAKTLGVHLALSIDTLTDEGLLSLEKRWVELASLRRTAQCGPAC